VADPPSSNLLSLTVSTPTWDRRTGKSLPLIASTVARLFFPQSKSLGIDLARFSPVLLKKIVYAGSNNPSFQRASQDLRVLANAHVPLKQVERLTKRIGQQRQDERDQAVAAWLDRPLAQREEPPLEATPPPLAVVERDGGRLQIRSDEPATAPEETEPLPSVKRAALAPTADEETAELATTDGRRARSKHWREDKVGCLLTMTSPVSAVDPCPEIPACFVDPLQSLKLAQQIGHCPVPRGTPFQKAPAPPEQEPAEAKPRPRPGRPEIESRRVLASRQDVHAFGPMLATAACALGLFAAPRRAFVADGSSENWSVDERYFCRWTAVLDFVHALTYVYAAAMAGRRFAEGWPIYDRWIRWAWAGQVSRVIEELKARHEELGVATKEDPEASPRCVVQESLTYLSNQQDKMRYDEYRKQGLPLMSSHVESTIKQINYRVKGTEKFWTEEGAEAILQLRADYLSDDEPLEDFWQRRQAAATGQRTYRRRSA
jgi:hypothetical protein